MQKPLLIGIVFLGAVLIYFNLNHYAFLKAELEEDLQELADISVNEIMEDVVGNFVSFETITSDSLSHGEVFISNDSNMTKLEMIRPFFDSIIPDKMDSSFLQVIEYIESSNMKGSSKISVILDASMTNEHSDTGSDHRNPSPNFINTEEVREQFDSIYNAKLENKLYGISFHYVNEHSLPSKFQSEVRFRTIGIDNELIGYKGYVGRVLRSLFPTILISTLLFAVLIFAYHQNAKVLRKKQALAEAKDDFVANITHELKTPISAVKIAMEAMTSFGVNQHPEKVNQYAEESKIQLDNLDGLINRILEFSNSDSKDLILKKERVNIKELIKESLSLFNSKTLEKQIQLDLDLAEQSILNADKLHLKGLINNLIDNAIKYTPSGKSVEIKLKNLNSQLEFSIRNHGVSLSPEEQSKLFDKFYRVPNLNVHNVKGHGLGLYYVKTVALAHGGKVSAISKDDWLEISLSLPKDKA